MTEPLRLSSRVWKAQGHGNDYLVFEEGADWPASPGNIRWICHPHRGVGGDGIVVWLSSEREVTPGGGKVASVPAVPFRLRMFNPDGSEFERSGNGLRVFGAYLYSEGRVGMGAPFPVEVGGDRVQMEILGSDAMGRLDVAVEMGRARFGIRSVNGIPDLFGPNSTLSGPDGPVAVSPVSIGNPHCVVFVEEIGEDLLLRLGPALTSHAAFPSGINVQLATPSGEAGVKILIWERGVGRTASSGTSACAVAAATVREGLLEPGRIEVEMEGGSFFVSVSREFDVRLEGPVRPVFHGQLAPELLKALAHGVARPSGDETVSS